MSALSQEDLAYVREVYPSLDADLRVALRYTNERHVKELLGEEYVQVMGQFAEDIDRVHEGLTGAIWAGMGHNNTVNIRHYIEEAAHLRHFLG